MCDTSTAEYNIKSGSAVRVRKVIYRGHATTIFSVDNTVQILEHIGHCTRSGDILPFALRLVEGDETIEIDEDNNEFAGGATLASCLKEYKGYNIMICVSRHVEGCYVSDMIQDQKLHAMKEAAINALGILHRELKKMPIGQIDK
jgi:hypothetical protein